MAGKNGEETARMGKAESDFDGEGLCSKHFLASEDLVLGEADGLTRMGVEKH